MKKVTIDQFSAYKYLSNIKVSNSGKIAFILKNASMEDNCYYSNLYLLENGNPIPLTASGDVNSFYWVGDSIYFPAIRKKEDKEYLAKGLPLTVVQRLTPKMGEAQEVLRLNHNVTGFYFLNEEEFLFTANYDAKVAHCLAQAGGDTQKAAQLLEAENDYEVLDELPYWQNMAGFINKKRNRLYAYDHGTITELVDTFTAVQKCVPIPGTKKFIVTLKRYENKMPIDDEMYLVDFTDKSLKNISVKEHVTHTNLGIVSQDTMVLQYTDHKKYGMTEDGPICLYNFVTGKTELIDESYCYNASNSLHCDIVMGAPYGKAWEYDGKDSVYFISTDDDSSHIFRCNFKDKTITKVTKEKGAVDEFVLYQNGFLAIVMRGDNGVEFAQIDNQGNETQLTHINTHVSEEYSIATPVEITFKNEVGNEIKGWYLKPIDFEEGKKYPVILNVHGGPKAAWGTVYCHENEYWANEGYGVIFCNPTGSDGKGNDFSELRGQYGEIDYRDIMKFVDICLEECPWMDGDRLGITGGSYGGFMTNWVIGHTDRFKAAASQRSISNWVSLSNTADIGYTFDVDQVDANVWENHDKVWKQSPLQYANQAKTPTVFIHSNEDYRCWMAEGLQMFYALRYFGVETRFCLFKGENHALCVIGKPVHRVRRIQEITQWMDKYLKA